MLSRMKTKKGGLRILLTYEFAAWDLKDSNRRTIYLLNIDWWSDTLDPSGNPGTW